jgi:predicted Holliday junction resolvase-like endonuclease
MIEQILPIIFTVLFALVILFAWLWQRMRAEARDLKIQVSTLSSKKQSLSTKYGKMTEQFMPFLETYPYDYHNFRFLGTPIDGVQFNDDDIVFVEFKAANSKLTERQRLVRDLVAARKVKFQEIRINDEDEKTKEE